MTRTRPWFLAVILACGLCFAGCDSLGEAAAQGTDAGLRALIDLLLTDLTNQVADSLNQDDEQDADDMADDSDDGADDTDDGTDDGADDDTDDTDGTDDGTDDGDDTSNDAAARGETLVADNCAGCHGADGASGFAPDIQGASDEMITDRTGGAGGHASFELSEQDSVDIAAYLASF